MDLLGPIQLTELTLIVGLSGRALARGFSAVRVGSMHVLPVLQLSRRGRPWFG
jgi:hypothetical protein